MRSSSVVLLLALGCCHAQQPPITHTAPLGWVEEDRIAEDDSPEALMEHWSDRPLHINDASRSEIIDFPFWTYPVALGVLAHRERHGAFQHHNELLQVEGVDVEQLRSLLPYVRIDRSPPQTAPDHQLRIYLRHSYPANVGHIRSSYVGPSHYEQLRYVRRYRTNEFAVRYEKDPGERRIGPDGLPEYLSGYLHLRSIKGVEQLIIGDFDVAAGQGLGLNTGRQYGCSPGIESLRSTANGPSTHRSNNEADGLRGLLAQLAYGDLHISGFTSYRGLDAAVDENQRSTIINRSGYHRTPPERARKNRIHAAQFGILLHYDNDHTQLGSYVSYRRFDRDLQGGDRLFQYHRFRGDRKLQIGMHAARSTKAGMVFGEWTRRPEPHTTAWCMGWIRHLAGPVDVSLHIRDYGLAASTDQSNGYARRAQFGGEEGMALCLRYQTSTLQSYLSVDRGRSIWPRYQHEEFNTFSSVRWFSSWKPTKRHRHTVRIDHRQHPTDSLPSNHGIRIHAEHRLSKFTTLRQRIEWKGRYAPTQHSALFYVEWIHTPSNVPLKIQTRLAVTSIAAHPYAIYAYKPVISGQYPIAQYNQSGLYTHVLLRRTWEALQLAISWDGVIIDAARTEWDSTVWIGSENEAVLGRIKHTFALQITYNP